MPQKSSLLRRRWLQVLVVSVLLYLASEFGLRLTGNIKFVPTILMVGAFSVPVAFVTYFLEREQSIDKELHGEIPLGLVMTSFLVGGLLGTLAAGLIEFETLQNLGAFGVFGVGLIEEGAKLIVPLALFFRKSSYRSEADGLVFGVASGMGFAALETMGFGLLALLRSQGDIGGLQALLLVRGLLSPAGHAAWTGIVCAVLWRERQRAQRSVLNLSIIGAFAVAVSLHILWNLVNTMGGPTQNQFLVALAGTLAIAAISLAILSWRARESGRWHSAS